MKTKYKPLLTVLLPMVIADIFIYWILFANLTFFDFDAISDYTVISQTIARHVIPSVLFAFASVLACVYLQTKSTKTTMLLSIKYIISFIIIIIPAIISSSATELIMTNSIYYSTLLLKTFFLLTQVAFLAYVLIPKKRKVALLA